MNSSAVDRELLLSGEQEKRGMRAFNLDPLTGLRGLCAISIVVGHALTFYLPERSIPPYVAYISAVSIFFIISGYTLTLIYAKPHVEAPLVESDEIVAFQWRRFARVGPMYYAGVLLDLPLALAQDTRAWFVGVQVPGALLGLQSLVVAGVGINGTLWQISAFFYCYLLFPRALHYVRRKADEGRLVWLQRWLWLAPAVLVLASVAVGLEPLMHILFPVRFPQFVAGIAGAVAVQRGGPEFATRFSELQLTGLMGVVWLALFCVSAGVDSFMLMLGIELAFVQFSFLPLLVMWVQALTLDPSALTKRVLCSAPAKFLGRISLSVYVCHWPVIRAYSMAWHGEVLHNRERGDKDGLFALDAWQLVPLLALVVAVGTALHYVVETPARKWIVARWG